MAVNRGDVDGRDEMRIGVLVGHDRRYQTDNLTPEGRRII